MQLDLVAEEGSIHGTVHSGFFEALFYPLTNAYPSIFQTICAALVEKLAGNNKQLYITGHSLGKHLYSCALVLVSLLLNLLIFATVFGAALLY